MSEAKERRSHTRTMVLVATEIERSQHADSVVGLIRDISSSGARLYAYAPPEAGVTVDLTLHFSGDPGGPTHQISAQVVRVKPLEAKQRGLWTHEVAVKFGEELRGYDQEIERLAAHAKKLEI